MRPIDADALVETLKDWRGDREDLDVNDVHSVAYYQAMSRAIRLTEGARTLDLAQKWISVKDRLPEDWKRVLVCIRHKHNPEDGYREIGILHWTKPYGWSMKDNYYEITHWMPLSEPPKED